jgi:hypothetical protein
VPQLKLDSRRKPEVIFVLANHNPRSKILSSILSQPEIALYAQGERFDLRFFVSSFAGYGMHSACMLPLDEFQKILTTSED